MSYIATVRYSNGHEGSKVLGIYSSYEEAKNVLNLYSKRTSYKILEIQHVTQNLQSQDLLSIVDSNDDYGRKIITVNGVDYESQAEYIASNKLESNTVFRLELEGTNHIVSVCDSEMGNKRN